MRKARLCPMPTARSNSRTSWSTARSLLNASKDEIFSKFNTLADPIDRDFDEYEIETEESGPVHPFVARHAF